jgi:hypothetical protein
MTGAAATKTGQSQAIHGKMIMDRACLLGENVSSQFTRTSSSVSSAKNTRAKSIVIANSAAAPRV